MVSGVECDDLVQEGLQALDQEMQAWVEQLRQNKVWQRASNEKKKPQKSCSFPLAKNKWGRVLGGGDGEKGGRGRSQRKTPCFVSTFSQFCCPDRGKICAIAVLYIGNFYWHTAIDCHIHALNNAANFTPQFDNAGRELTCICRTEHQPSSAAR